MEWTERQPGKADRGHKATSLKCKLWRVGCGWGWWFRRLERRELRLCYSVVAQSWPGKIAEMGKRRSQVAPGQLEDCGTEVG